MAVSSTGDLTTAVEDLTVGSTERKINQRGSSELGKEEFLKLLVTQLQNQDPLNPQNDTEFISQLAQFSSLEQMTNMSTEFTKLANMLNSGEAVSLLGRSVEVSSGESSISGVVEAVTRGANPQIKVNGMLYSMDQINAVYGN